MKVYLLLSVLYIIIKSQDETCTLIQDKDYAKNIDVVDHFNRLRYHVAMEMKATTMYKLKKDGRLIYLAEKTLKNCDQYSIDDGGYRKIRFQMGLGVEPKYEGIVCLDFVRPIFGFMEHVSNKGHSFANSTPEYQGLYELLYANQTMIGCGFKTCTSSENRIFNMLCYLGPKKKLEGSFIDVGAYLCGNETLCQKERKYRQGKEFEKHIVDFVNSERRELAKRLPVANMYKMVWDNKLAGKANKFAKHCFYKPIIRPRFIIVPVYPAISSSASKKNNTVYTEHSGKLPEIDDEEKKALFWWNHTKIGCVQADEKCGDASYCAIGKRPEYYGEQYAKGQVCSYCAGSCDDGLCFKRQKTNGTASGSRILLLNIFCFLTVIVSIYPLFS